MTDTQTRVMEALARFEAGQAAEGRAKCECCGNWSRGECGACNEVGRAMQAVAVLVLAPLAA